jgi:hypothetical protein
MNPIVKMTKRYLKMPLKYALPLLFIGALVLASTTGCVDTPAMPTPTTTGTDAFRMQSFIDQVNEHEKGVTLENFTRLQINASTGDVDAVTWHNDTTFVYIYHFNSLDNATANYNKNVVPETKNIVRQEAPNAWGLSYYTNVTGHAPTVKKVQTNYVGGTYQMHQTAIQYDKITILYAYMDNPNGE